MPDTSIAIAIMLGSFAILLMLRMPISFTLGISSVLTALYLNIPLATLFQRMVSGVQSFSLLAIPFFILAGEIMGQGGISRRLITLANAFVGWMRGGLAQVNISMLMWICSSTPMPMPMRLNHTSISVATSWVQEKPCLKM